MNHERLRWARMFDVPMKETTPPGFPANTLPVGVLDTNGLPILIDSGVGTTGANRRRHAFPSKAC